MADFARRGSQRWLQIAVNRKPELLLSGMRRAGAIARNEDITWKSPLETQGFREYRGSAALQRLGIKETKRPFKSFWPSRGAVWDALGKASSGTPIFVEAKAHIPEAASPGTKASAVSRALIDKSLLEARRFYAPRSTAVWNNLFYQYANRLAHHYFLTNQNRIKSTLVFLYFLNADDMLGPMSEEEWRGAVRLIHAILGLPKDLQRLNVFDVFLDARLLQDASEHQP